MPTSGFGGWRAREPGDAGLATGELSIEQALRGLAQMRTKGSPLVGVSVVGPPGSGKTTLLKRLFTRLRRGTAHDDGGIGLSPEALPVYVRIASAYRGVVGVEGRPRLGDLLDAACAEDAPGAGRALLRSKRPLLVLLDGLDEVADEGTRIQLCEWLCREVRTHGRCTFVITCRNAAWGRSGDALHAAFLPLAVLGFDQKAIRAYIAAWFPAVVRHYHAREGREAQDRAEAERLAASLIAQLFAEGGGDRWRLGQMSRNPLLLSVICLVQFRVGQLPETRAELYAHALRILIEQIHRDETVTQVRVRPVLDVLRPVAWHVHTLGPGPRQEDSTALSQAALVERVGACTSALKQLQLTSEVFVARLVGNGVWLAPDVQQVRFAHLTFQEYLAAKHANAANLEHALAERRHDPWWREVILLSMAQEGFFARFLEACLARGVDDEGLALLDACRAEAGPAAADTCLAWAQAAAQEPPPPPVPWWRGMAERVGALAPRPPSTPPGRTRALLALAHRAQPDEVERLAPSLVGHHDPEVAALAQSLAWTDPRMPRPAHGPAPGERRTFRAGDIAIEAVWVPPGRFLMGSSRTPGTPGYDPDAYENERPAHQVALTRGFWLGRFPVTNQQFAPFAHARRVEASSLRQEGLNHPQQPVAGVTWFEAMDYGRWLLARLDGVQVELPTEAEWEWSARGEDGRRYPWGSEAPSLQHARFSGHGGGTAVVGERPAGRGPFGAEEQAGNVLEWCASLFTSYRVGLWVDPCHRGDIADRVAPRVLRGGSWSHLARHLRCARRLWHHPRSRYGGVGFRVVFRPQHGLEP